MISVFTDRIEILSHGGLGLEQDLEGFYKGVSIPVNEILASIFLQLRLSERSGRGVPKIVEAYGRDSIKIQKNFIVVTIPFNRINVTPFELNEGAGSDVPNGSQKSSVESSVESSVKGSVKSSVKIIEMMKENPEITIPMMAEMLRLTTRAVEKSVAKLQAKGIVKRVGPDKGGHWEVLKL